MRKLWAWRERRKRGPPPDPLEDDERAVPAAEVWRGCAAAFAEADAIDVTLAWDLLRRRVANKDEECATGLTSKILEDGLGGLEAVLAAEDDDEAMRACADAVCGAWARCARAREARGRVVERAAACAGNLINVMQLALTVRAYVACAESLQSLCRTSPEACREILRGEGVRVLATALAWCVLDEDMSKGGLLKVVDTDLGCALVDLLTVLAGADATKIIGDLEAEAPALVGGPDGRRVVFAGQEPGLAEANSGLQREHDGCPRKARQQQRGAQARVCVRAQKAARCRPPGPRRRARRTGHRGRFLTVFEARYGDRPAGQTRLRGRDAIAGSVRRRRAA